MSDPFKYTFILIARTFLLSISGSFVFCISAFSQIYPFNVYTVKDDLINANVYDITRDHYGFTWMATRNGLSKYDGVSFINYPLSMLGLSSGITAIEPYKNDEIIFACENNGIYRMGINKNNPELINKEPISAIHDILIRDSVIIALYEFRLMEFISISTGNILAVDSLAHFDGCDLPLTIYRLKNSDILVGRSTGLYKLSGFSFEKINTGQYSSSSVYSISEGDDQSLYIGSDNLIYKLHKDGSVSTILELEGPEIRVRNLIYDNRGNLWFNPWGSSQIKMIRNGVVVDVSEIAGGINSSITTLYHDTEGNIWAGTLGKGAYQFKSRLLTNFPVTSGFINPNIRKLIKTEHGILMGTSDGVSHLHLLTGEITYAKHIPEFMNYVRDIIKLDSNEYIVSITDFRLKKQFVNPYSFSGENLKIRYVQGSGLLLEKDHLLVANWDNRIVKYHLSDFKFVEYIGPLFPEFNFKLRINTIAWDEYGNRWVGSKYGTSIEDKSGNNFSPQSDIRSFEVFRIIKHGRDTMKAITSNGLYIFQTNQQPDSIKELSKTIVPGTTCMIELNKDEYLFGTADGLILLRNGIRQSITVHDGLLSNIIEDLLYTPETQHIYIASAEGLMQLDLSALRSGHNLQPLIRYAEIEQGGRKRITGNDPVKLRFVDGSFNIRFNAFYFENPRSLYYQYRVNNGEWKDSPGGEIQVASIDPGDHHFEIRAGLTGHGLGPATSIMLYLEPPFYRTWWFYLIMCILTFLLLRGFYLRQMKIYRRKHNEKTNISKKLVELQQKALASNLNPHFVFNSLNSIQHFINSNSPAAANEYLAKFSRLMRMHLNMADKSYISLNEEITRLENYLGLEQMRFGDQLSWKITLSPEIDPYIIEIPNMIIQPFIENAIWHGIMPSNQQGVIELNIAYGHNENIEIKVSDNGVGLEQAKATKSTSHESKGVKLIRERLALLDPDATNALVFENLTPGTLVIIHLTQKMYRNVAQEHTLPQ